MRHFLVAGSDQEKPALEALNLKKRDNLIDFSSDQSLDLQLLELANEDQAITPGVHWLEAQPEAVQETKALLPHPEKLTLNMITDIEALFSEPEVGITVSQEDLRRFLHQQEGKWVVCVSG